MRFAEITDGDGTVDRRDDLRELDVFGLTGECVSTSDTPLGPNQTGSLEGEQDLFEVGLGETGSLRDVAHRRRTRLRLVEGQAQQSPTRIITPGRNTHVLIVGGRDQTPAEDVTPTTVVD